MRITVIQFDTQRDKFFLRSYDDEKGFPKNFQPSFRKKTEKVPWSKIIAIFLKKFVNNANIGEIGQDPDANEGNIGRFGARAFVLVSRVWPRLDCVSVLWPKAGVNPCLDFVCILPDRYSM